MITTLKIMLFIAAIGLLIPAYLAKSPIISPLLLIASLDLVLTASGRTPLFSAGPIAKFLFRPKVQ